jgi:hypothetical protein
MSFALTTKQFMAGTKTVTRRNGWANAKPGERVCAVEKGMGLRKGERIQRLGIIEFVDVRREPLNLVDQEDVIKEGFPDWTPPEFIDMYCKHNKRTPESIITRLEYQYLFRADKPNSPELLEFLRFVNAC